MIEFAPEQIADVCGGEAVAGRDQTTHPKRAVADSREVAAGDLFFGIVGENVDGGSFALDVLQAGAWGVVVGPGHVGGLSDVEGVVIEVADPVSALGALAKAWRREIGATTLGITGSVGKTSTKDILAAMLGRYGAVVASPQNYNTEIGLPLTVLSAPRGTEYLILEMAMRGQGQIAELAAIAEPDLGAITNIGPVHLELLGTVEAVAVAKGELFAGLTVGAVAVAPVENKGLFDPLPAGVNTVQFADRVRRNQLDKEVVQLVAVEESGGLSTASIRVAGVTYDFSFNFQQHHNLVNATCAVAICHALGLDLAELAAGPIEVVFSRLRGELVELPGDIVAIQDCYNANPVSMAAALEHLASINSKRGSSRLVAVLGEMAELGKDAVRYHREVAQRCSNLGVSLVVGVGELAREYEGSGAYDFHYYAAAADASEAITTLLKPGDTLLLKGSRSVGLEVVAEALA